MSLWSVRSALFKLSFSGIFVGFIIFIVGFSTPFWLHTEISHGSQGLWLYCHDKCHILEVKEDWFQWVRTLECLALIVYFAAGVVGLHDNFLASFDPLSPFRPSHRVEVIVSLAGSLGVSGLALYSVMLTLRLGRYYTLGWSYVTTSSACTITFIAAIFMGITNKVETRGAQNQYSAVIVEPMQTFVMSYQSSQPAQYLYQQPLHLNSVIACPVCHSQSVPSALCQSKLFVRSCVIHET